MEISFDNTVKILVEWIQSNRDNRRVIRITGSGASGKSILLSSILEKLESKNTTVLNTDPYLVSPTLRQAGVSFAGSRLTACHPEATFLPALQRDISMLKSGKDILSVPDFDHSMQNLPSTNLVIVEGIGSAFLESELFDLNIFVYCDSDIEKERRISRDLNQRNLSLSKIEADFQNRRDQFERYIMPKSSKFEIVLKSLENFDFDCESDTLNIIAV